MQGFNRLIVASGTLALLAGCMHRGSTMGSVGRSSGDVSIDSLSASRTAILRIQNNYPTEVRVYTLIGGQENYVAKAMPGEVRTTLLDPTLFPNEAISFIAKPVDGATAKTLGPYKVDRGQTVEMVVPKMITNAQATLHRSTP